MLNKDDKMHPEDQRNMIIFIIVALMLFFAYDQFVIKPKIEAQRAAAAAQQAQIDSMSASEREAYTEKPREEVIAKTSRVKIDNGEIFGSLNLTGGRIDDVSLKNYFETLKKKESVHILSPSGSKFAKYVEHGWVSSDNSISLPSKNTQWIIAGNGNQNLSPDNPVTLTWDNGQGLSFERKISIDDDYLFTVEQIVRNAGVNSVKLAPYALVSEHGLPEDFVGQFVVHEGPIAVTGKELEERSYKKMRKKDGFKESANQGWAGITEKYWLTALVPTQDQNITFRFLQTPAKNDKDKERYQVDIVSQSQKVAPGSSISNTFNIFVGAKEVDKLNAYEKSLNAPNFHLAVDFGMFWFLTQPFFSILNFFYDLVGNFGLAIILITVLLRAAVFPLANTSFKSFAKMKQIAPQMTELRETYGDNKQKLQEEMVKLYQREKVNPAAGCFPILIQIPIFFALYKVLTINIEMRHQPFFGWIQDLSAPDPTTIFNAFGLIPWDPPGFLMIGIWPCLMMVSMIFQRKLSPPPQDPMQAKMIAAMPYFMTFILAKFASGLVIYWTFSNLLSVLQQYIIMKRMGVEVHLFSKDKKEEKLKEAIEDGPAVHPAAEMIEEEVEDAAQKVIKPPKPKKSKKRK